MEPRPKTEPSPFSAATVVVRRGDLDSTRRKRAMGIVIGIAALLAVVVVIVFVVATRK